MNNGLKKPDSTSQKANNTKKSKKYLSTKSQNRLLYKNSYQDITKL